jgi:uncharacterized protein YndB with AHSA1/START domain
MPEITATEILDAPAPAVWALLADFGAIQRWWPRDGSAPIARVEIEGDGIGMIRHIYNRGAGTAVSERLDLLDPLDRRIVLSIVGARPVGITAYVAEGRLEPLSDGRCRIHYRALVTTQPGVEIRTASAIRKTWSTMFRGLEAAARQA